MYQRGMKYCYITGGVFNIREMDKKAVEKQTF